MRLRETEQKKYNFYKNLKTDTRRYNIEFEKKEYNKILKRREELMLESLKRVKNTPKYTFINYLRKFIPNNEITEAMIEKEEELSLY